MHLFSGKEEEVYLDKFKAVKGKKHLVFVGWGEKNEVKRFTIGIADAMEASKAQVTKKGIPSAGHGMNKEASDAINQWLINTAEPILNSKEQKTSKQ